MFDTNLQTLCERGQQELMETRYLAAARTLAEAEASAWERREFDTLARLYLPLQEARRQIRQRCGEGAIRSLLAKSPIDEIDPAAIVKQFPHGQLLVAGWGSVQSAAAVRRLAGDLYLETFLAAVYSSTIVIAPLEETPLPAGCLVLRPSDFPQNTDRGTPDTFARSMAIWEKLHTPFLAAANQETDPILRMAAYRLTLRVDPACELAHQFLADTARKLARG